MRAEMNTMKRILNGASRDAAQSDAAVHRDDYVVDDRRDRRRALGLHRLGVATAKTFEQVALVVERLGKIEQRLDRQAEPVVDQTLTALAKLEQAVARTEELNDRLARVEARIEIELLEASAESLAKRQTGTLS